MTVVRTCIPSIARGDVCTSLNTKFPPPRGGGTPLFCDLDCMIVSFEHMIFQIGPDFFQITKRGDPGYPL